MHSATHTAGRASRRVSVGWSFAFAIEAKLAELKAEHPGLCSVPEEGGEPDCLHLDLAFAGSLTVLTGLILCLIKPLTHEVECGKVRRSVPYKRA